MPSIQQILENVTQNFTCERLARLGLETFLEEGVRSLLHVVLLHVGEMIEEVDQVILTEPHLRRGWKVKDGPRPRQLETRYGTLCFSRRYYEGKEDGQMCYLLDRLLGIPAYSHVEGGLAAHVVQLATEYSFAQAAELGSENRLTKQTVSNLCRKVRLPKQEFPCRDKEEIKTLHLQVDEDHIRHQRPFSKKRGTVDMVVLHEPKEKVGESKGRYALKEPLTFLHPGGDSYALWDRVAEQFYAVYGSPREYRIFLHGDGGAWIKRGLEYFPGAIPILDRFHLEREIQKICGSKEVPKKRIRSFLEKGNLQGVHEELSRCIDNGLCSEEAGRKFYVYVQNQQEGILNGYLYEEEHGGSCAEALVRHGLSERFSTGGKSWSSGLASMVKCREYCLNGEKITSEHIYGNIPEEEKREPLMAGRIAKEIGKKGSAAYAETTPFLGSERRGSPEATIHKALLRQGLLH